MTRIIEQFPAKNSNQDERKIYRCNRILKGINHIISISLQGNTEKELINTCLSVALEITDSQVGFIGEVDFNGLLHEVAASIEEENQCKKYERSYLQHPQRDFILNCLYGRIIEDRMSFLTNYPLSCPDNSAMPHGHPSLTSFLGVPLLVKGEAIGLLAVANREEGYSPEQLENLEAIAPAVTQALRRIKEECEHKQAENALHDAHEQINAQSDELQMQSEELQIKNMELQAQSNQLKKAKDTLEEKVEERTAELEQAYISLKESKERLSEAQEMVHIGNWDRNLVTNELYWSDEMYRIFGITPGSGITYNMLLSHLHPDDRDYADSAVKRAIGGETFDIDHRIISGDGEERIVHAQGKAIFDEKNTPIRIRGIVQDITERKRAEEALCKVTEHERFLADIVEKADMPFAVALPNGSVLMFNQAFTNLTGYSHEELTHKQLSWITDLTPLEWREKEAAHLAEAIRTHHPVRYEKEYLRKDGTSVPVELLVQPVFDTVGNLLHYIGFLTDITKRKQAEDALKKQVNLIDLSPDAIITHHLDGTITFWSKGAQSLYGWTSQEAIGQVIYTLLKTRFPQPFEQIVKQVQQTGYWSGELIHCTKDGRQVIVQSRWKAEFDNQGNVKDMLESNVDITERKKVEEDLAKIEIVRKKEIHHRIKNNLQVISSLLDLQAEKFNDRECINGFNCECTRDLKVLEAFRESQDRVISMALIHEELYKGGEYDTLNFSSYLEELAENLFLTYRLKNENVSLIMDLEENIFFDMDTAVPLGIIVNELVSNSLKHAFIGKDKGEIQIKIHREEIKNEDCKSTPFIMTILDNGVGIPENLDIENFDSLGLQLVITLVDQLDGELELNRENGTEFTIRFTVTEKSE